MVLAMMLHHLLAVLVHLFHAVLGMVLMLLDLLSGSLMLGVTRMRVSGRSGLGCGGNGKSKRESAENNRLHVKSP